MTTTLQHLNIIGYYENNTGRWYVTEDRVWKVRINDDHDASAIRDGREVYRLIGDNAFNARTGSLINRELNIHRDVVALVANARRAEHQ